MTTVYLYGNDGKSKGVLDIESGFHRENLDGTDRVEVTCRDTGVAKRDRLVWQDEAGTWHEHIVDNVASTHQGGSTQVRVTAINSIYELSGALASGTLEKGDARALLARAVAGTAWSVGACSNFGKMEVEFWNKSVRQVISDICSTCLGELETSVAVDLRGVTARHVGIRKARGNATARRQFRYTRNITNVTREVSSDEVYTAMRGIGAKVDDENHADYAPRYTVNVYSKTSLAQWGTAGGTAHNWATYTDDACTDVNFLRKQCEKQLAVLSKPVVVYSFDVVAQDEWSDLRVGDRVSCVDDVLGVELLERVTEITRYFNGRSTGRVVIGSRANPMVEKFKATEKVVKQSTGNRASTYNRTATRTSGGRSYSSGASGGSGLGDGWTHQVNGVTASSGIINFVTSGSSGSSGSSTDAASSWGSVKKGKGWTDMGDGFSGHGGKF